MVDLRRPNTVHDRVRLSVGPSERNQYEHGTRRASVAASRKADKADGAKKLLIDEAAAAAAALTAPAGRSLLVMTIT